VIRKLSIWLPSLAEQRRIVAKVDELMAVLDALIAATIARLQ
jgi:restriction endonuclease S subunit